MRLSTLCLRSLTWHRRIHTAVVAALAAGAAALTGALLVGDSIRGSLRELALRRLCGVQAAMLTPRLVRPELAADLASIAASDRPPATHPSPIRISAALILPASASHPHTNARANRVQAFGVGDDFWHLLDAHCVAALNTPPDGRSVVVNQRLAAELGARPGDEILLRVGKPETISPETLLGRRDDAVRSLRLTVRAVLPDDAAGGFSLALQQVTPANAFLAMDTLQRAIDQPGRANAFLARSTGVAAHPDESTAAIRLAADLQSRLSTAMTPADYGLRIRTNELLGYAAVESDAMLMPPPVEAAARAAAAQLGVQATPILTYLANEIRLLDGTGGPESRNHQPGQPASDRSTHSVPYSTVVGVPGAWLAALMRETDASPAPAPLQPGQIALNDWAASRLGASPSQRVLLRYYLTDSFGRLSEGDGIFTLAAIVPLRGPAADPGLAPEYPGVTDAQRMSDWDPPFPVDFTRIGEPDEAYWQQHRATPKAFITLADAERLWAHQPERFGRCTSLHLPVPAGTDTAAFAARLRAALQAQLDPAAAGFSFEPVRAAALAAATGSTDFGTLFLGFSFFLIAAAAMLVTLLMRLGIEQRSRELGLLLASGYTPGRIRALLLAEGAILAVSGAVLGAVAAGGYAWLMLAGLRGWWSQAANAPFLRLHTSAGSIAVGSAASALLGLAAIAWALRGLLRQPPRRLLAGDPEATAGVSSKRRLWARLLGTACLFGALLLSTLAGVGRISAAPGFFGAGVLALIWALALVRFWLDGVTRRPVLPGRRRTMVAMGARNAGRNPVRSMLTAGMLASATFLIVSLSVFRLMPPAVHERHSGSGGFTLYAEASVPIVEDVHSALRGSASQESGRSPGRGAPDPVADRAAGTGEARVFAFRLRDGDSGSCRSLLAPRQPRILGAPREFLTRGGFRFAAITAAGDDQRRNPWLLLERPLPDGAIPVIGDEASVRWQYHLDVGQELAVRDGRGRAVRLRFVALLSGSFLQDELIVSEAAFERLFPAAVGYGFFLIEADESAAGRVEAALEQHYERHGLDVARVAERLRGYFAVQNTYLLTFQQLGGLGLAFGSLALAAIALRNVFERRRELALMRAVGFSDGAIRATVLAEHAVLLAAGVLAGVLPALIAVAPTLRERPGVMPWGSLTLTILAVVTIGLIAALAALRPLLRERLIGALRSE